MHKLRITALTAALLVGVAASPAYAIQISINDAGEIIKATPGFGLSLTQEGPGVLGDASYHFEYISADPNIPAPGASRTFNVNWWEDAAKRIMSDTLSITITGHVTPDSNVSVDLSFLSDSLETPGFPHLLPTALANPDVDIREPQGWVTYSPLSDLQVRAISVPEPGTLSLLITGLASLGFGVRKRKTKRA